MDRIDSFIDRILYYLLGLLLAGVVLICFAQVIARYVFVSSFTWAEEVSIVILLWAAWLGACVGVKENLHLKVILVEERLRPEVRYGLQTAMNVLSLLFLAVILYSSRLAIDSMANMTLGSLPFIPMNTMYWSVPVGSLLLMYYCARSIRNGWRKLRTFSKEENR
jgi:TRAP-type C4-dicarboxylate transport system permease small subunit